MNIYPWEAGSRIIDFESEEALQVKEGYKDIPYEKAQQLCELLNELNLEPIIKKKPPAKNVKERRK